MKTFSSRPARIAALVLRMALGLLFIVSAILKLVGIDEFEIYLFSFNVLQLNAAFLFARLVIIAELLVGIGLLANIWNKFVDTCALLMMVVFSVFLCYAALIGRTDSCHCMGPLISIDPVRSLLKNAVLIVLLLVSMGSRPWKWRPRWFVWLPVVLAPVVTVFILSAPFVWLPVVLAPVVTVFILSAPDNWLFGPSDELYDAEMFKQSVADDGDLAQLHLDEGRHVVAFLSPGCSFCRMADEKLTYICRRDGLDSAAFVYLLPSTDSIQSPLSLDSVSFIRPGYRVPMMTFLKITYGQRPMVFLLDDGNVEATFHYRNIDEHRIDSFLRNKDEDR